MRVQHTTAAISLTLWVSLLVGCGADPEGPANAGRDTALPDAGQDTNDGGMDASETDDDMVTVHWNVPGMEPNDVSVTVNLAGSADSAGPIWTGTAAEPAELNPGIYSVHFEAEGFTPYSFELEVPPDGDVVEAPPAEMEAETPPIWEAWSGQTLSCVVNYDEGNPVDSVCWVENEMLDCDRGFNPTPISDPNIVLYDDGFDHDVHGMSMWECRLP